jgi:thioredoxin-related protein
MLPCTQEDRVTDMLTWYDNNAVADAIAAARESRKPLLVDFYSPTCSGCAKLFATTYRDARVKQFIREHFVSIKYNTKAPNQWFKRLNGSFAHHWHPDIAILDERLTEAHRFIGYLAPDDFITRLEVGLGLYHLYHTRAGQALDLFRGAAARRHLAAAPEARYWAGVAAYRAGGGLDALAVEWRQLTEDFPRDDWTRRADCLDVAMPPEGFSMSDPDSVSLTNAASPGAASDRPSLR